MKAATGSMPSWLKWVCRLFGALLVIGSAILTVVVVIALISAIRVFLGPQGHSIPESQWTSIFGMLIGRLVGQLVVLMVGVWLVRKTMGGKDETPAGATPPSPPSAAPQPAVVHSAPVLLTAKANKRFSACNILHIAPDAKRLWQFDAKGGGFTLAREQRVPHTEALPVKGIAKNWASIWQPKLNIAWLPPESVFLRVVELPAANAEETLSMVEMQLEKLSPIPVTQIVWTMHPLGTHQSVAKADGTTESLQTVVVVIAARNLVEEFLGRLEREGFLADRLEVPMLDQLAAIAPKEDGTWLFPLTIGGQNAALVAWWYGGALRSLGLITIPVAGDRVAELKTQISLLAMAGEVEGWLNVAPRWHLVADPVNAAEWENLLRTALGETVAVSAPPSAAELAGHTARRAASAAQVNLLPAEFTERYRQQFTDRLWLHGLGYAGLAYAVFLVFYFCAVTFRGFQTTKVEGQVAAISNEYTNTVQLQAQFAVLQKREQLKFAALDCWQVVAQELPSGVQLQRMNFTGGQQLSLSGTTTPDLVNTLFDFDTALRKHKVKDAQGNEQSFFDPQKGTHVNPVLRGGVTAWNITLELMHATEDQP